MLNSVDYDQIRSSARQGSGSKFMMYTGSAPTAGYAAVFDSSGNLVAGSGPPGTGGGGGSQTPWTSNIDGAGYSLFAPLAVTVNHANVAPSSKAHLNVYQTGSNDGVWIECPTTNYQASIILANDSQLAGVNFYGSAGTIPNLLDVNGGSGGLRLRAGGSWIKVLSQTPPGPTPRIGIGVDTPAYPLDVLGDVNLSSGSVYRINGSQLAAANVVNAVSTASTYADPAWITSLAWSKITGAPASGLADPGANGIVKRTALNVTAVAVAGTDYAAAAHTHAAADITSGVIATARLGSGTGSTSNWLRGDGAWTALPVDADDTSNQRVKVSNAGTLVGTRPQVNFIQGSNATLTIADDSANNRVNVTIAATGAVTSVFTRTGAVTAQSGDYTAAQVTNAVSTASAYADPAWITSLAWSKITGAPSVSSYQTPWLSDINGGGFKLSNVSLLGVGGASTPAYAVDVAGDVNVTGTYRINGTPLGLAGGDWKREVPSGAINGSNTVFTLSATPSPAASLQVARNGVVQATPGEYSATGNTITFVTAPGSSDTLQAQYAINGLPGSAGQPYDVVAGYVGKPGAAATVWIATFARAISFGANFTGSSGTVGVNPAATAVYTVKKGASTIGTVSISTSGVFTFATTGGAAQSFAAGDRMTIVAPSSQDATLSDVAITLVGTR